MGNVKNKLRDKFSQVPNELIFDNTMSDRARFLYVYMAAKPDDWDFYMTPMAKELNYSVDTLRKYLNELIDNGWITKGGQSILEKGKWGCVEYVIEDIKIPTRKNTDTEKYRHGKNHTLTNTDYNKYRYNTNKKTIQKDIGDESPLDVETSVSPSTEIIVDLEIKNQTPAKQQKEIVEESPQVPPAPLKNTRDEKSLERFEKEWHTYGKKVDKKRAWSLYKKLTNEQQIAMHEALPAYIASTPDVKFRKNLSTYISQESWDNEIINNTKNTNQNGGQQAQAAPRKTLKYL